MWPITNSPRPESTDAIQFIDMAYGMMNNNKQEQIDGMNQRQVAKALGVSRTAIQQTERRAFRKIIKILSERGLTKDVLFG